MDYRDHRPDLNTMLFVLLASGLGLRQTARVLGFSRTCTMLKFRKIARHLRGLNRNLRGPLSARSTLQLDEFETYEGRRNTRPLTVPVLIERESRFVIGGGIRPNSATWDDDRRPERERSPRTSSVMARRKDESRRAIRAVLSSGAALCRGLRSVVFQSDEKLTYPSLAERAFGARRLLHETTNSKVPRWTWNPLFPINHTEAMLRDLMGRLRRDSWLVSKKAWCLDLHLQLFMSYRNYMRRRFNYDRKTPAQILGFVDRPLSAGQLLSWRQDWGLRSIHPLAG